MGAEGAALGALVHLMPGALIVWKPVNPRSSVTTSVMLAGLISASGCGDLLASEDLVAIGRLDVPLVRLDRSVLIIGGRHVEADFVPDRTRVNPASGRVLGASSW